MLEHELHEIVEDLRRLGADDADVEAKRATSRLPKSVRCTLSAFANTRGGVLILGLDEESGFAATGVHDAAAMTADLVALCAEEMDPPLRPRIKSHRFEGVDLVVAEIAPLDPRRRPCHYVSAGITKGSFVRVGDSDRRLSGYEVHLMLANHGQPRDDEELVTEAGIEALDPALVDDLVARLHQRHHRAFGGLDREAVLRRAKVLVGDRLTVAGLLTLGEYPQHYFPQLMITFVHFPKVDGGDVTTGERFIDNIAAEGPVPVMISETVAAVRRNMSRRSIVEGVGRSDVWEYPEVAIREAIVNAIAHRDYSPESRGAQVQVEMYPDRLVVRNPGGLFGSVTASELGQNGATSTRNATLLKLLEDVRDPDTSRSVCENRGSGIPAMMAAMRSAQLSPPEFTDKISLFTVTFPNHTLLDRDTIDWLAALGQRGLTESQCVGLAKLRNGDALDNQTYRSANGLDSRIATDELADLVTRGIVRKDGGRRWARYVLVNSTDRTGTAQHTAATTQQPTRHPVDRREQLLAALGEGVHSRAELVDLTALTPKIVTDWLRKLRKEGTVEIVGTSSRSPHVRYRRTGKPTQDEAEDEQRTAGPL